MAGFGRLDGGPRSAVVVGAGIVGLSTAWFLQERGVSVTVVDRAGVAAGASCRWSSWTRAVHANLPLNDECVDAFDVLTRSGVTPPTVEAPITAGFETPRQAQGLLRELRRLAGAGQAVEHTELTGDELRELVPLASRALTTGVRSDGQRHVDPGGFVLAVGRAVVARGATIQTLDVVDIHSETDGVTVRRAAGKALRADVAVLATGAWLSELARKWGARVPVRAGRGYSFTVPVDKPVPGPIYLPDIRVACTPYRDGLRIAGTMEFRDPDAPAAPARLAAIIAAARPFLDGVRWDERRDVWVGPRPVTPDGRPLVGVLRAPNIYVTGGHGMWGLAHGPITGRLLADQITTGKQSAALRALDPLR